MVEYKGFRIHDFTLTKIVIGDKEFEGYTHYHVSKIAHDNADIWIIEGFDECNDPILKTFKSIVSAKTFITKYLKQKEVKNEIK